jgi:hypothetical protein
MRVSPPCDNSSAYLPLLVHARWLASMGLGYGWGASMRVLEGRELGAYRR